MQNLPLPLMTVALNRFVFALLFVGGLFLTPTSSFSQSFTFADAHPVNNPDSLEQWLVANSKAPALVRLKNLIALERTRYWLGKGKDKMSRHLPQIHALATQTQNPTALAAYEFLKAQEAYRSNDLYSASLYGSHTLSQFEKLNDVSGLINTHCLLFSIQFNTYNDLTAADSTLTEAHWHQMRQLLAAHPNPHDLVFTNYIAIHRANIQAGEARAKQLIISTLRHMATTPACCYAQRAFELMKRGAYYNAGDFKTSYAENKKALSQTTDVYELAVLYNNLGNDCLQLNRLNEGLIYYDRATQFALACSSPRFNVLVSANEDASKLAAKNGLFKKAYAYLEQARIYERKANAQANNQRMQEFQARYESARRQRQIDLLQKEQAIAQLRSNVYVAVIGVAVLVLAAISLLAWRLYRNRQKLEHTNQQLNVALAEVQQLNKAREHFIGIIAHDMRKPLISFRGMADLVSNRLKQRAYADIQRISQAIDLASVQIETMLDNLLRWALAQREIIPYQPQNLHLNCLLHRVADLYQHLIQFQDTHIRIDCPDTLHVWADDNGLQLMVRNLLDNALKSMGPVGEVGITASVVANEQVQIQLEDTGEGMEPDQLTFLQELFAGHTEGQVGEKGLGLGLLLVRDFATRNHGHVEVVGLPEHGTRFTIYMPLSAKQPVSMPLESALSTGEIVV